MPLNVEDFSEDKLSLSDYEGQVKEGAVLGKRTSSQQAATSALIAGEGVQGYKEDKEAVKYPDTRQGFIDKHRAIRKGIYEDARSGLVEYLADPLISDADKLAATTYNPDNISLAIDTMRTLAENSVAAPSGEDETPSGEKFRFNALDSIEKVNRHKRDMQSRINSIRQERDPTVAGTVVDVAELMAPFAEWIHYDQLQRQLTEGSKNWNLMGEQKRAVFEAIQSMPIDKRAELADAIIRTVTDNENVVLPDGNDLVLLESLEKMLVDNDYSDFERWFDNSISILEMTGVGGLAYRLFSGGAKAAKEAGAAAKAEKALAKEAEDFQPEIATTDTALQAEADSFKAEPEPTEKDLFPEWMDPEARKGWNLEKESKEFVGAKEPTAEEIFRKGTSEATRSDVDPASPSQVVKEYNPQAAREMHELARDSDEAAEALYGTSKEEAMAKDILPESSVDGSIPNKVSIKPSTPEPELAKKLRKTDGETYISVSEKGKFITERLVPSFENIEGLSLHKESLVVATNDDQTVKILARYSPVDHGFSTGEEAVEAAQIGLSHVGIPEDAFKLYQKNGVGEWVPVKDGTPEGEYAVVVDYDYKFRPEDLSDAELLSTGGGFISRAVQYLDRIPSQWLASQGQGSVVQHFLDPHSTIHPQIVNPMSVATDRGHALKKLYIDEFSNFTDTYKKLKKDRRALVTDYIHQANDEGLKFNVADLYARGFTKKEVEALKTWRRANDVMWYAANQDMVKSLRSKGNKVMVHKGNDTKLIGKPVNQASVSKDARVYDVMDDINVSLTDDMRKFADNETGQIIKLAEPINHNGQVIEYAYARGTPGGGYIRTLADDEIVLNYRDGYYPVAYDANYFIKKYTTTEDGRRVGEGRVIASAKDTKEVKNLKKQIMREEGLTEDEYNLKYDFRKDRRLERDKNSLFDEGSWSLASNSGISNQRVRGQRLADAGVDLHKRGTTNLKDPLQAVSDQIHTLSQRVAMRDTMDTMKQRWVQNYGKYLDLPEGKMPNSISGVKSKAGAPERMVQDARTNFNYIYSMENGYINSMDNAYKAGLHMMANQMAELGIPMAERAFLGASGYNPSSAAKGAVFKLLISSNPARQAVIQRTQMLTLGAANPQYAATRMVKDVMGIDAVRMGASKNPEYVKLFNEMKDTGILEAVDSHNLLRRDHLKLADLTWGQKARSVAGAPLRVAQKIGFDAAEQDVLVSAYLAFRDKAIKADPSILKNGVIKNQRVKDEIVGQARAYMLNMNRSGEMPYSQNTLGVAAQFFSFQHKAFLQVLTNRSLTNMQRAQLLAYQTAVFGMDATIATFVVDQVFGKEPNEVKDLVKDGLLDTSLNAALSALSGTRQAVDFGALAPSNAYGVGNVLLGMASTDLSDLVVNSPAGSLLFGANPRIQNAFKEALRYFSVIEDYDDPTLETNFSDVLTASLQLFSGYSAAFKANYAFETGKALSSSARITDSEVTKIEALSMTLGFPTKDQEGVRQMYEAWYGNERRVFDSDIEKWYSDLKGHVARKGLSASEQQVQGAILGEAWRVFGNDRPQAMKVITSLMEKDAKAGDYTVINGLMNQMGLMTDKELWKLINKLPDNTIRKEMVEAMKLREEMLDGSIRE